ncbi:hypothetical protein PLESTB_001235400 [Pleodorina starrii]|uniref:SUN domain-containing protein n=1 Tax=Pleodorina starrii TaxID=330485 RepID=A0A9W6F6G8_9CHLO|nr:hypothetical protein PLESTM_000224400 [Pleodorina starrii]GLC57511.1 hypothetical protein PLESTB_001235400 [Pleodorina starrii]GLC63183.1 hypothetical protein PLESTF_000009400 [Pleodorina starrii]
MSRRVGGGRGRAKKDDLAKAAAEVLNNINVAPTPAAAAHPTNSAGLLRNAIEEGDVGTDVQPKQLQVLTDQEPPLPDPSPPPPAATNRHRTFLSSKEEPAAVVAQPVNPGEDGGGTRAGAGAGAGGSSDGADGGTRADGRLGDGVLATPSPDPDPEAAPAKRPLRPTSKLAAAAATAAARCREVLLCALPRRAAAAWPFTTQFHHFDDLATARDAGINTTTAAAAAAVAALVLLLLGLSASGYSLARAASRAQGPLRTEVGELRTQLQDWRRQAAEDAAATHTEVREQLRGARLEDQRLGRQLAELDGGLETVMVAVQNQAAEIRSLRHALEARDAVQNIARDGGGSEGSGGTGAAAVLATAVTVTSATETTIGLSAGGGGGGGADLRGLPACHAWRLEAAAGPLLTARVSRHSAVAGDEEALMRFHSALSHVFAPERGGARIHPLARQLTNPAAAPPCLPLAAAAAAGGDGVFLELTLTAPANVSAVSFRYPPYGTWDTSSALLKLSATLHEAPAAAAAAAAAMAAAGGGGVAAMGDVRGLRARRVELPMLRGVECQHVAIPPGPPAPFYEPPMLVRGITLHVHDNFGNRGYSCMPRVLVHGWAG